MTREERQQLIKDDMEYHMEEFNLSEEEAQDVVADNYILGYLASRISEEDLLGLMEAMGYSIEIEKLREERQKRAKLKAYRKELRARHKKERETMKAKKEVI